MANCGSSLERQISCDQTLPSSGLRDTLGMKPRRKWRLEPSMVASGQTRQSELLRVLEGLASDLPNPAWVALVDAQGLIMGCVPKSPPVAVDSIGAMSAVVQKTSDRVLREIKGGSLRYGSIVGANWHFLSIVLGEGRILSVGLQPEVSPKAVFGPLRDWVRDLNEVLDRRFGG